MSVASLRAAYSPALLAVLPAHFGAVMRGRMRRCFATHPNRTNPWARALLLGELAHDPVPAKARAITFVLSEAAAYLERAEPASFDGFALSNILDGTDDAYRGRLFRAVIGAAAPGALVVGRSFAEPTGDPGFNRAADDRSMLWGIVDVRPVGALPC
jgi:hypothetical protein